MFTHTTLAVRTVVILSIFLGPSYPRVSRGHCDYLPLAKESDILTCLQQVTLFTTPMQTQILCKPSLTCWPRPSRRDRWMRICRGQPPATQDKLKSKM